MECSGEIVELSAHSAEREGARAKHVIVYYVHAKCGKFLHFLAIRQRSKAQQATAFFC